MKKSQAGIKAIAAQLQATPNQLLFKFDQPLTPKLQQLWQRLEDEMQYVNQLATEQESAVLRLNAIIQRVERDRIVPDNFTEPANSWQFLVDGWQSDLGQNHEPIAIPYIEKTETGDLKLATRLIHLAGTEPETQMAQPWGDRPEDREAISEFELTDSLLSVLLFTLKQVAEWGTTTFLPLVHAGVRALVQLSAATVQLGIAAIVQVSALSARRSQRLRHSRLKRQTLEQPADPLEPAAIFPSAQEALILAIGAALMRILLDRVSLLYPALSLISILLMVCPAAIAVYQSTVAPQSGFLWGCRLTLMMLGLLLGGRV